MKENNFFLVTEIAPVFAPSRVIQLASMLCIISDSDSGTDSNRSNSSGDNVPLSERWKNLINQRKWNIPLSMASHERYRVKLYIY